MVSLRLYYNALFLDYKFFHDFEVEILICILAIFYFIYIF